MSEEGGMNEPIFSVRRQLASNINESTDVLWSNESLGEVTDAILAEFVVTPRYKREGGAA